MGRMNINDYCNLMRLTSQARFFFGLRAHLGGSICGCYNKYNN